MLRESGLGRRYLKWVELVPVPFCQRLALSPNHLTFLALFFSLLILPAYVHSLWLGGLAVLAAGALDTLDGGLARRTGRQSKTGAFLDSVFDRYSDFFIHLGLWLYFWTHYPPLLTAATLLLFFLLLGSFMVSYTRARGEGLGLSAAVGFFGRGERILTLGLGSLLADLFPRLQPAAAWARTEVLVLGLVSLLVLGVHLSALQRIIYLARRLR
ncbi:MAG: CDP-alcohol phosphatidyltransferase family protein [Deltaproteobacteria bacterium]|nr:CDP-alcohol phosphatidyltransferase family protein [Deltaproteobacteria bacterium]